MSKRQRPPSPHPRKRTKFRFPKTYEELKPLREKKSKLFFQNLKMWFNKQPQKVVLADLIKSAHFDSYEFSQKFNKEFEGKEVYAEDVAEFAIREKSTCALRWYAELFK